MDDTFHPGVAVRGSGQSSTPYLIQKWQQNVLLYFNFNGAQGPLSNGDSLPATIGSAGVVQVSSPGQASRVPSGYLSESLALDTPDSYVRVSGLLGAPQQITLMAWVNIQDPASHSGTIISLGDYIALSVQVGGSQVRGFFYDGATWQFQLGGSSVNGTGWHHLAYSVDGIAGLQKIYLDGVLVSSGSDPGPIVYSGLGSDTVLGDHGDAWLGTDVFKFYGQMDEVAVVNTVLSDADIQAIVASDQALRSSVSTQDWSSFHVIARYRFDASAPGGAFHESSGLFSDATCPIGPCPTLGAGKFGDAFYFNEAEYLALSETSGLIGGRNEASISFWAKFTASQSWADGKLYFEASNPSGLPSFAIARDLSSDVVYAGRCCWLLTSRGAPPTQGDWHHYALTVTDQSLLIYIDGELSSWGMFDGRWITNIMSGIGAYRAGGDFYQGAVDDFVAFDQALTLQQVQKIYRAGQSGIAFGD